MEFSKLHVDCNCNCTEGATEDTNLHYVIKTMKNVLRENDFKSYWEKGRNDESIDCDKICSLKGNSVSILNNEVRGIFKQLFGLAPNYKPYFTIIKFGLKCGVLKSTPNTQNPYHYDFYKSDSFEHTQVELIESTLLHD